MELRQRALQALCTADPLLKVAQARDLQQKCASLAISATAPTAMAPLPGRPERPELIHPAKVPRRSPFKPEGLVALLHAIAHIEFNAIKKPSSSNSSHFMKFRRNTVQTQKA